jgi:hypothetical protein
VSVGGDHPLVDAPGSLDVDVRLVGEQGVEPVDLLVGEQVCAGVEGAPRAVERVALVAAVSTGGLLDPASALIECLAGQACDMEGIIPTSG